MAAAAPSIVVEACPTTPPCAPTTAPPPIAAKQNLAADEARLASENRALFRAIGLPEEHHGGRRVAIPAELAMRLHASLLACFERGNAGGNAGGLHVVHGGEEHVFWGFETYDRVQAPLDGREQRKHTTMLPVHEVEEARWRPLLSNGIDGFDELTRRAKAMAGGLTMLACHMLRQGSLQACFSWHQDSLNKCAAASAGPPWLQLAARVGVGCAVHAWVKEEDAIPHQCSTMLRTPLVSRPSAGDPRMRVPLLVQCTRAQPSHEALDGFLALRRAEPDARRGLRVLCVRWRGMRLRLPIGRASQERREQHRHPQDHLLLWRRHARGRAAAGEKGARRARVVSDPQASGLTCC